MSVDAMSMHREVDRLVHTLDSATRKAEGVRALVDEWTDAECSSSIALLDALSENIEELESVQAHTRTESASEAESKLEVFESACMLPLGDKERSVVCQKDGQRL